MSKEKIIDLKFITNVNKVNEELDNNARKLIDLTSKLSDVKKEQTKYKKEMEEASSVIKTYNDLAASGATITSENKKEMEAATAKLEESKTKLVAVNNAEKEYKNAKSQSERASKDYNTIQQSLTGSFKQQETQLRVLKTQYKAMDDQMKNTSAGKQLKKDIDELDKTVKGAAGGIGEFQKNVGNYTGGIVSSFAKMAIGVTSVTGAFMLLKSTLYDGFETIKGFEQANANLASVLGSSRDKIKDLTKDAERLGAATEYTAIQVSSLQYELSKLGFNKRQILDATEAILQFATATGSQLPEAAALAGSAVRAFGLNTSETQRVVSAMGVATTKSALSFNYLNTSMSYLSPIARSFGFSIEDTLTLLSRLADSGFDASMAGTATRSILLKLADSGGELAKKLGRPVRNIEELAVAFEELRNKGVDLGTALELTDVRAASAFITILNGAEDLVPFKESITDVSDELKKMQEERLDTTEGSIKLLKSAWDGLMLSFSDSKGGIKKAVDGLTSIVNALTFLSKGGRKGLLDEYAEEIETSRLSRTITTEVKWLMDAGKSANEAFEEATKKAGKIRKDYIETFLQKQPFKAQEQGYSVEFLERYDEIIQKTKDSVIEAYNAEQKAKEKAKADADAAEKARLNAEKKAKEGKDKENEKRLAVIEKNNQKLLSLKREFITSEVALMKEGIPKLLLAETAITEKTLEELVKRNEGVVGAEEYIEDLTLNIRQQSEDKKLSIIQKATDDQLQEYIKASGDIRAVEEALLRDTASIMAGNAAYIDGLFANIEKKKADSLKAKTDTSDTISAAESRYAAEYAVIQKLEMSDDKRKERNIKNNNELLTAKIGAYRKELEFLASIGEIDTDRFKEILEKIKEATDQVFESSGDSDKGGGSLLRQMFGDTDGVAEQIMSETMGLIDQVSSAIFQAEEERANRRLQIEKNLLKNQVDSDKKALEDKRKNGKLTESQYQKELERIDKEAKEKEIELEKKAFEEKKKLQIKQAIINGALAITNAIATAPTILAGFIMAAAAAASTALQIATISKTKYAKGGVLQGNSHANGGIQTHYGELEGGEAVINKHSTAKFAPLLSKINSYNGWGVKFANGGITRDFSPAPISNASHFKDPASVTYEQAVELVKSGINEIVVVLRETDLTDNQSKRAKLANIISF